MRSAVLRLFVVLVSLVFRENCTASTTLNFLGFFPLCLSDSDDQCDMLTLSAVKLAIENINEDLDLLNSYDIELLPVYIKDPEQDPTEMIRILYQQYNDLPIHGVIGPYHTDIAQMFAYVFGHYLPTLQISYSVTDASLHNKSQYPYFYTTVPTDQFLNKVRIELLNHFGWREIGVLCSDDAHLVLATQDLISQLKSIRVLEEEEEYAVNYLGSFISSPNEILLTAKSENVRIFIAIVEDTLARALLCQAYRTDLTTADHVWILPGIYDPQWWSIGDQAMNSTEYNCTDEQMMEAINSTLFVDTLPTYLDVHDPQIREVLSDIFNKTEVIQDNSFSLSNTEFHQLLHSQALNAYDATRALALAWNVTLYNCNFTENDLHVLLNQSWKVTAKSKQELVNRLQYNLENIISPYSGLAGMYLFNSTQNTFGAAHALVTQFNGDSECVLGIYESLNNGTLSTLQGCDPDIEQCCNVTWKGNYRPFDRPCPSIDNCTCRAELSVESEATFIIFLILFIVGFVASLALLPVNFWCRNNKHFKSSSPNLNVIITVGCSLSFVTGVLLLINLYVGIKGGDIINLKTLCNVYVCFNQMSGAIIISTIILKNWRIFRIFHNPLSKERKHLSDKRMYLGIILIILPVVIALIVFITIDPFLPYTIQFPSHCPNIVGVNIETYAIEDHCIDESKWDVFIGLYIFLNYIVMSILGCYNSRIPSHYKREGELAILTAFISAILLLFYFGIHIALTDTNKQTEDFFVRIELQLPFVAVISWLYPSFILAVLYLPKAISITIDKRKMAATYRRRGRSSTVVRRKLAQLSTEATQLKHSLTKIGQEIEIRTSTTDMKPHDAAND